MRFSAFTALFLASLTAISASPIAARDSVAAQSFKLLVSYKDSSVPSSYLKADSTITSDASQAATYTLTSGTSHLYVNDQPIAAINGFNFTSFIPYDSPNTDIQSFYLTNGDQPFIVWSSPSFVYAEDNIALFATQQSTETSDTIVYAFFNGEIPEYYTQAWLVAENIVQTTYNETFRVHSCS